MISEEVLALEPDIIAWRRHMHQNPELSFQEVHTTAYLTEELKKIPGLTLEFPTKTGVVAVLKGVQPGPVLALRADIDARFPFLAGSRSMRRAGECDTPLPLLRPQLVGTGPGGLFRHKMR